MAGWSKSFLRVKASLWPSGDSREAPLSTAATSDLAGDLAVNLLGDGIFDSSGHHAVDVTYSDESRDPSMVSCSS